MSIVKPLLGPCAEVWRDIPGYEGTYQASSLGRIKSLAGIGRTHARYQDIVLSPVKHHTGYHVYSIGPECKSIYGHKLVAWAFLGEPEEGQVVCHFDGSRDNNRADNLRYDTHSGNEQDKRRHGTYQEGAGNPRSVLTEDDVVRIRNRRATGEYCYVIARDYGMRAGHISKICTGQLWPQIKGPITRSHYWSTKNVT